MKKETRNLTRKLFSSEHHARVYIILGISALILFTLSLRLVSAADGDLDLSFGGTGKVTLNFFNSHDEVHAIAIQPDGKLVAAGSAVSQQTGETAGVLVRYNPDGTLDASFGVGGKVLDPPISGFVTNSVALLPSGKIIVGGYRFNSVTKMDFAIARYNADGQLDPTFNVAMADFFGDDDHAWAMTLQPDGKIIQVGVAFRLSTSDEFGIVRYNPDGTLDSSFGVGGKTTTGFSEFFPFSENSVDRANTVAVQADGKIIAGGVTRNNDSHPADDFALARYNPDGTLDLSFGTGGKVKTEFPGDPNPSSGEDERINSIAVQSDGKIVAVGRVYDGAASGDFGIARYNSNGSLDATFGTGGLVTTNFFGDDEAFAVAIQPNGKLLVAGKGHNEATLDDFALVRYLPDGSLDPTFGVGGKVTTDFFEGEIHVDFDGARCMAIQSDGKIVLGGAAVNLLGDEDFAIARYNSNTNRPPTANAGADQTTECQGVLTNVTLDGAASSDPDGNSLTYEWREGTILLGTGEIVAANLSRGTHTITLTVTDTGNASSQDSVVINVVDSTPPSITAPSSLNVITGAGATACGQIIDDATLGTATASDCCSNVTISRSGVPAGNFFPVGTTTVSYTARDASGLQTTATQNITVVDATPPTISNISASPSSLWPPNHKFKDIAISYDVSDNCGSQSEITCGLSVTSNEPINGEGDGDTAPDWLVIDAHAVRLRAERAGNGNGRVYTITVSCRDSRNNAIRGTTTVTVPH
jgi:uncharacterized delta-60 repeat protein